MPGSRGSTIALVPLSALALLVGGFLIARPDRPPETAHGPTATLPPAPASPAPLAVSNWKRPLTRPVSPGPPTARTAARHFLSDYLRLIRGRQSTRTLSNAAPGLRRDLRRYSARPTPVQQLRPATIRALDAKLHGPGSARAVAILQNAGGPPYPLLLYLERRGARWLVTRIGDA